MKINWEMIEDEFFKALEEFVILLRVYWKIIKEIPLI